VTSENDTFFGHYMLRANNTAGVNSLGQLTIDFNPAFQSVVLHSLHVLRGNTVIDKQPGLKVRFLEREPGLENSIYTGVVTIAIVMDDLRIGVQVSHRRQRNVAVHLSGAVASRVHPDAHEPENQLPLYGRYSGCRTCDPGMDAKRRIQAAASRAA
jgi:hypothetical protein